MASISDTNRRWWTLTGCCAGLFLLMLDSTIVTLALPEIQRELDATTAALQWVMNGYLLVLAMLVVTLGRVGDMYGRRKLFVIGMAVFAAGSAISALASDDAMLIAGRVVQGAGGAALLTLSLAIVSETFDDAERPRALGIWAAVSALALSIGPVLGGVLIEHVGWRAIFWINLPVAAAGVAILLRAAHESRDEAAGHRIDVPGLIAISGGLTALVLALIQSKEWGFDSPATIGLLAAAVALLAAFWFIEHRVAQPIVEFPLFRNGPYLGASAAGFALVGAYWSVIFFQPQYLQSVLGYSAVEAGLLILPITVPMAALSPFSGRLIAAIGARRLMTVGMAIGVAGLVVLTRISDDTGYGLVFPGLLLFGVALGLVYAPMSTAAMTAMPRAKAGIAAGVLAMNRVLSGALWLAVAGTVFLHIEQDEIRSDLASRGTGEAPRRTEELEALVSGADPEGAGLGGLPRQAVERIEAILRDAFSLALAQSTWVLVGLVAVGAVLTWLFVRSEPSPATARRGPAADLRPIAPEPQHHHFRFHL